MIHKISPQSNKNQKKVQFDSARVSFQVEYDIPDDRSLRHKIPVWTEHWKKSKSGLLLQLLRTLSLSQWLRIVFLFICLSFLSNQLIESLKQYLKRETLITADYSLPSRVDWPSLSLCIPIVIPFCNQSCSVQKLFNQSLTVFHRCRHVTHEERAKVCSQPLQWIHGSKKCFTYSNEEEEESQRLELFIQSEREEDIQLFVHQKHSLPFDEKIMPSIHLKPEKDIQISFFKTTLISAKDCSQDNSFTDCLSKCLFRPCVDNCVSRLSPIRSDLVQSEDLFCRDLSNCDHSSDCQSLCSEDCLKTTFHLSLLEQLARDQSERNISLKRQLTPDLTLRHMRRTTCLELLSQLGGLIAFWLSLYWLWSRFLHLLSLLTEILEIYFK